MFSISRLLCVTLKEAKPFVRFSGTQYSRKKKKTRVRNMSSTTIVAHGTGDNSLGDTSSSHVGNGRNDLLRSLSLRAQRKMKRMAIDQVLPLRRRGSSQDVCCLYRGQDTECTVMCEMSCAAPLFENLSRQKRFSPRAYLQKKKVHCQHNRNERR